MTTKPKLERLHPESIRTLDQLIKLHGIAPILGHLYARSVDLKLEDDYRNADEKYHAQIAS